jgi:hypothetical protein
MTYVLLYAFRILRGHGCVIAFPVGPESGKERPGTGTRTEQQHLAETIMSSPHLPAETLDHIVDHLHDAEDALRNCCLVSKSWVPRTRKHLFAEIDFRTVWVLKSWKKTFPDPSTSPAHYARALSVSCPEDVAGVDAEAGGWIRDFSRVVRLEVGNHDNFNEFEISLAPFHGLSPAIKSLRINAPEFRSSRIFDLILSFPLVEDVAMTIRATSGENGDGLEEVEMPTAAQPSSPLRFTGSLELCLGGKIEPVTRRFLSLPGGIHFWKLALKWLYAKDLSPATAPVEGCSHTLKSLGVTWSLLCKFILCLCPNRQLTPVSRRAGLSFVQPFQSDKTWRCNVSARLVERPMGHHGTPNHLARTPRSSTDHDSAVSRLDPLRFLCQRQAGRWRSQLWAVVRP